MKLPSCFLLLLAVTLGGCSGDDRPVSAANEALSAQRKQAVQAALNAGPQTRSWQTSEGAVIELTIPRASITGRRVEYQRCIVWRDAITKSSSMHCDRDDFDPADYPTDPPDHSNLR